MRTLTEHISRSLDEGWWGYGPTDGDEPLDIRDSIFEDIFKELNKRIDNAIQQSGPALSTVWASLGAGMFFMDRLAGDVPVIPNSKHESAIFLRRADALVMRLRDDSRWISSWEDQQKIQEALDEAAAKIQAVKKRIHFR